jgi:small-conductance mechanosensitive channel
MAEPSDLNPLKMIGLSDFNVGLGAIGNALLLIVLIVLIFGLIGVAIFFWIKKRQYKYGIPIYSRVGNVPTRIGYYKAKEVPMGRAGDRLWFVGKLKKFIPPANMQSAPREFWHWLREDGELVNFSLGDLDEDAKKSGVKYIHQDMRMQRLATDKLLEQRLMQKTFWEKWGLILSYIAFFLVLTVAMVIIFWQWGNIVERLDSVLGKVEGLLDKADKLAGGDGTAELVPALVFPLFFYFKLKWKQKKKKENGVH